MKEQQLAEVIVRGRDLRSVGYCTTKTKVFFEQHGLDWRKFIREGLPSSELEATGDAMAIKLCEVVRERG